MGVSLADRKIRYAGDLPAPILSLISVYMARTYEKVPDRKAFLEKMAAAERNAAQIVEKTLASYSKISKK